MNYFVRITHECDCDETCICNGGDKEYCSGCIGNYISIFENQITIDKCPFYKKNYKWEEYLTKIWNEKTNSVPVFKFNDSPVWLNESMALIGNVLKTMEHESQNEQIKQQRRDNLKFVK